MSKVIVVASGKGGTGKSTVSVGLAVALVKLNKKVLLVDCDSGMRGIDLMLGVEKELVYDVSDAVGGGCDKTAAIYVTSNIYGLYMMPAALSAEDEVSPEVLRELIEDIKNDYDYIVIDSPAGTGSGFDAAAAAADRALIVVNPEPTSVRGCLNIHRKLAESGKTDVRLVINRFDPKRFVQMGLFENLDELIDKCETQLIAVVPEDIKIASIAQRGQSGKESVPSMKAFENLALRIEGQNPPLPKKLLGLK